MANYNRNFGILNKPPPKDIDRENIHPGGSQFIGKDNLLTERRHIGRKQAFGEIKNVFHNQNVTPMKGQTKVLKATPLKLNVKKDANIHIGGKHAATSSSTTTMPSQKSTAENNKLKAFEGYEEDLEYAWSQQSILTDSEIERIVNGDPEEEPCAVPPIFMSLLDPIFGFDIKPPVHYNEPIFTMPEFPKDDWSDLEDL